MAPDQGKGQQWGITPPVSMQLPTEHELKQNNELMDELKRQQKFESPEGVERRKQVLTFFQNLADKFVKEVSKRKNLPESVVESSTGLIQTYGSYRLGVYGPDSDIDTLLVAPKHISRDDFFDYFPVMLQDACSPGDLKEAVKVRDAFVPIIMIVYKDISVDLIFVSLKVSALPPDIDLKDNNYLRGLDETDLRSINGVRVTDEILTLVPQVKAFRGALRAIKSWAQQRAIYSNISGFPGGVAWAMITARICQLYPMAASGVIVGKMFELISRWTWPRPIQLKNYEGGPLDVREWNPQLYGKDRKHLMPVITPAYPSMCATNNINHSTKAVIVRELNYAAKVYHQIYNGEKSWKDLFQKHTFFTKDYKYYLSIIALSRSQAASQTWSGLVHSKVRRLVESIETLETGVEIAHPFIDGYDRLHKCKTEDDVDAILHGEMKFHRAITEQDKRRIAENNARTIKDEKYDGQAPEKLDDYQIIYTTTYYVGLELKNTGDKKLDISHPVGDFKNMCLDWESYSANNMAVCTVHTRNYDLPDDLFAPGEKKPDKLKKKKRAVPATNGPTVPGGLASFSKSLCMSADLFLSSGN